jgi:hypothetical protein
VLKNAGVEEVLVQSFVTTPLPRLASAGRILNLLNGERPIINECLLIVRASQDYGIRLSDRTGLVALDY